MIFRISGGYLKKVDISPQFCCQERTINGYCSPQAVSNWVNSSKAPSSEGAVYMGFKAAATFFLSL